MKKATLALATLLATSLMAFETPLVKDIGISTEMKTKIENISLLKKHNGTVIKVRDIGDIYLVEGEVGPTRQFMEFAVTKDLNTLILGKFYEAKTTKELHVSTVDTDLLLQKADFTYGTGPKTVFVFVDPTCPGCSQFEKVWPQLKDKYTIKVFIWALPSHTLSPVIADYILSAPTDAEKYERLLEYGNKIGTYKTTPVSPVVQKQIRTKIAEVRKLAVTLSLTHTPTVLDMDLKEVQVQDMFKK